MERFEATVDAATLTAAVLRDGFAIVGGVLADAEVDRIGAGLRALLADQEPGTNSFVGFKTKRIFSVLAKSRLVDELVITPVVLGVLDGVLDKYQLSAPVVIEIHPGERAQTLHRDSTTYPLVQHEQPYVLNVMWAFDDFTEANGATRLIPGSHRWPDQDAATEEATVRAVMPKGSICIFLGNTVHGGGANASEHPRLGVTMEYAAAWLRPQENFALSVPRETARLMPTRLTELIGYDLYPPFLGYVDGRNPRELLTGPVT
jgi:ectoine hydroxylase-related dioxygenase (phytanoyl-CoA dioxygenase family)